jgi:predicted Na+-dependent transporter
LTPLAALAAWGRWLLVAGLLVGIAMPTLARAMAPAIVPFIVVMLCLAALREGPVEALPRRGALPRTVLAVALLQCGLPLVAAGGVWALGWIDHPLAIAAVLAMSASPITGSPGLAAMSGANVGASLRQLSLGTALLPFTAAPVFAVLPLFSDVPALLGAVARLLLIVVLASGIAHGLRRSFPILCEARVRPALDGAMALAMALVVIGLMSAIGPALLASPGIVAVTLAFAGGLYLLQSIGAWIATRHALPVSEAHAITIAAGNRNLALFLTAVPEDVFAPLMIFVGCYQIPMYLTPFLVARLRGA